MYDTNATTWGPPCGMVALIFGNSPGCRNVPESSADAGPHHGLGRRLRDPQALQATPGEVLGSRLEGWVEHVHTYIYIYMYIDVHVYI